MTPPPFPALDAPALVAALRALRDAWRPPPADAVDALSDATGWPRRHAARAVARAFAPFTDAAIARLVATGRPRRDRPVPGPWLLAILAGRVPALAANVVLSALAARVPVVLKPAGLEPSFATALARATPAAAPALANAVGLLDAPSGSPALRDAVARAPLCLAYGADATIDAVRAARPGLPTLAGGHRESAVIVFREALAPHAIRRLAAAIARDVAIYDQSGCLSPQAVLVEDGGTVAPAAFARALADALARVARDLSPAPLPLADAAAVRLFAQEARLLARASGGRVLPDAGPVPPLVAFEPALGMRPGPGFRTVQVLPFAGRPDLNRLLSPLAGRVQGLALAGPRARLADALAAHPAFAAPYVCAPGRLQSPPAGWAENGTPPVVAIRNLADGAVATPGGDRAPSSTPEA